MVKTGTYRHFKGDTVEVIGEALHSETLEPFVVYRHTTGKHAGEDHYWVRPAKMFLGAGREKDTPIRVYRRLTNSSGEIFASRMIFLKRPRPTAE